VAFANIFLGVRQEAHGLIKTRLQWNEDTDGPYSGPVTDREHKFFRYAVDHANTQRLFKTSRIAGKDWTLWNMVFTEKLSKVKEELDNLLLERPDHISVVGAWQATGEQFGTEHVYSTRTVTKTWSVRNPDYQPTEFNDKPNPAYQPIEFDELGEPRPDYDPRSDIPDTNSPRADYDPSFVLRITGDVEEEFISGHTGTALYPVPTNALLKFMPDKRDEDGNVTGPATELTDVNLILGQSPRSYF
jgi:hypothetical protein